MAELESSTSLAQVTGGYTLNVKDLNPDGTSERLALPVPQDEVWAKRMLIVGVLKRTTWSTYQVPSIILAVLYAESLGLDILQGDVYMAAEGRLSTTAGAKIKHARSKLPKAFHSITITEGEEITIDYKVKNGEATWSGPELFAKVEIWPNGQDKGQPFVYETTLSEWFLGTNPNWRSRPRFMLRKNALSKAYEEIVPMGTESDEATPIEQPQLALVKAAAASALADNAIPEPRDTGRP